MKHLIQITNATNQNKLYFYGTTIFNLKDTHIRGHYDEKKYCNNNGWLF